MWVEWEAETTLLSCASSPPFPVRGTDAEGGHVHQQITHLPGAGGDCPWGPTAEPCAIPPEQVDTHAQGLPWWGLPHAANCQHLGRGGTAGGDHLHPSLCLAHAEHCQRTHPECAPGPTGEVVQQRVGSAGEVVQQRVGSAGGVVGQRVGSAGGAEGGVSWWGGAAEGGVSW